MKQENSSSDGTDKPHSETDKLNSCHLPEYAIDWGHNRKLAVHNADGPFAFKGTLGEFISQHSPCRIYIECTFESYFRHEHNQCIIDAEAHGSELWTINPRTTARERTRQRLDKTDQIDAAVIWQIAHSSYKMSKAKLWDTPPMTRKDHVERLRRSGYPKNDPLVKEWLLCLPPCRDLAPDLQDCLGNTSGKRQEYAVAFVLPMVAAALDVIEMGGDRTDFGRRIGHYGTGYPSLLRSNYFNGRLRTLQRRATGLSSIPDNPQMMKTESRRLQRACRFIFAKVKESEQGQMILAAGTDKLHSETDNTNSYLPRPTTYAISQPRLFG